MTLKVLKKLYGITWLITFANTLPKHFQNMLFEEINKLEGKETKVVNKNMASDLSQSTYYTLY